MISRNVKELQIHCSNSDNPNHDNIETIKRWHTLPIPKGNSWSDIGYHFVILRNGTIKKGRPLERIPASILGHNKGAIAICLTGKDDFTYQQFLSCAQLCAGFLGAFKLDESDIIPHNKYDPNKTCPNFPIEIIHILLKKFAKNGF